MSARQEASAHRPEQPSDLRRALDHVGGRWTLLLIQVLLDGPKRFNELTNHLRGISTNLLTERLRELEASRLIKRRVSPPPSSIVTYELTAVGRQLSETIDALSRWGRSIHSRPS